jgi:hypothetical protein
MNDAAKSKPDTEEKMGRGVSLNSISDDQMTHRQQARARIALDINKLANGPEAFSIVRQYNAGGPAPWFC